MINYFYFYLNFGDMSMMSRVKYTIWSSSIVKALNKDVKTYLHIPRWPHVSSNLESEAFIPLTDYFWHFMSNDIMSNIHKGPFYLNRMCYYNFINFHRQYGVIKNSDNINTPTIGLDCDTMLTGQVDLVPEEILFYKKELKWFDVPWGILNSVDAQSFIDHLHNSGICKQKYADKYECYNSSVFYAPKNLFNEWWSKYQLAYDWFIENYPYHWEKYSIFDSIILSILAQDSNLSINTIYNETEHKKSVVHLKECFGYHNNGIFQVI